jgi:3-hydroxyisobutyrate dehydrogenase-like beta-hydroxyacid dehydrogenase
VIDMSDARTPARRGVTVLGLGPMGRAIAGAFTAAGHPTTGWNRTTGKADDLARRGVRVAATVADAVAASTITIISVLDYAAADELLDAAAPSLPGATIVNLTSDTPERSRRTATWVTEHDGGYLDGAIMTPTSTIGTPAASVLVSGSAAEFQRHRLTLACIGTEPTYLGGDAGRAAAFDVALLDLFWTTMSGATHALALAQAEGIEPHELLPHLVGIAGILPPILTDVTERVAEGRHADGTSSIRSASAAMTHIAAASRDRGLDDGVLRAAWALAKKAIDAGHGDDEISRLVETVSP